MSQKELAAILKVSQPMISQLLTGQRFPSHEKAIEIAVFFGVCVEWLLTGRGPKTPGTAAADVIELDGLDNASKAAMRAAVDSLKKQRAANHD